MYSFQKSKHNHADALLIESEPFYLPFLLDFHNIKSYFPLILHNKTIIEVKEQVKQNKLTLILIKIGRKNLLNI